MVAGASITDNCVFTVLIVLSHPGCAGAHQKDPDEQVEESGTSGSAAGMSLESVRVWVLLECAGAGWSRPLGMSIFFGQDLRHVFFRECGCGVVKTFSVES